MQCEWYKQYREATYATLQQQLFAAIVVNAVTTAWSRRDSSLRGVGENIDEEYTRIFACYLEHVAHI